MYLTIGERIKKLRKELTLTQQAFADKLGVKRDNIAGYETEKRSPSEAVISLICKTFNVNEKWLRNDEGEIFIQQSKEDEIRFAVENLLSGESSEFKRRLIKVLTTLKEDQWIVLEEKLNEIVGSRKTLSQTFEQQARAEAEQYYQELLHEKKAAAESAALRNTESNSKMA